MKKQTSIKVTHKDLKVTEFAPHEVKGFQVMPEGFFYIEGQESIMESGEGEEERIVKTLPRTWIATSDIKGVQVTEVREFAGAYECTRYRKFKEHGIDIAYQTVAHTEPPTQAEVEKKLEKDPFYRTLKAKEERQKYKN